MATVELLARLRQLEMPTLERPSLQRVASASQTCLSLDDKETTDDVDTSVDAPELEAATPKHPTRPQEKSTTFHFTSDNENVEIVSKEAELSYISLSSSDS